MNCGRFAFSILILVVAGGQIQAASEALRWFSEPASELEARLLQDGADGNLDDFELLDAALIAGGIGEPESIDRYRIHWSSKVQQLRTALPANRTTLERARFALEFLHDRVLLGKYRADCTQVAVGLDQGEFNCVTATILYLRMCDALNVPAVAVATTSHVFARIDDGRWYDVQTTHRRGITPTTGIKDGVRALATSRKDRQRTLTPTQLVAKVYYNRGVVLLDQRKFEQALPFLGCSDQLDSEDLNTRENILAAINNWALAEADAGNFDAAAKLILNGLKSNPAYEPFLANDLHIHQRWSAALAQQRRYEESIAVLEARLKARPDVELFDHGRFPIYRLWAQDLLRRGNVDEVQELFVGLRQRYANRAELASSESGAFASVAQSAMNHGDTQFASQVVQAGLSLQPKNPQLLQIQSRLTGSAP